jgi:hypothetical protein
MPRALGKNIYVTVPTETANKATNMAKITKEVLGKIGCPACHSGFNIKFVLEKDQEVFKFNEKLESKASNF